MNLQIVTIGIIFGKALLDIFCFALCVLAIGAGFSILESAKPPESGRKILCKMLIALAIIIHPIISHWVHL